VFALNRNRILWFLIAVLSLWSARALAVPTRIVIAVSSAKGTGADRTLKHAARDADRISDTLVRLGDVPRENVIRAAEPSRAAIDDAFSKARAIAGKARPEDVMVFFYFSGHGDKRALHLNGEELGVTELAEKMATVPAVLRMVLTDACRTQDGRSKGPSGPSLEPGFAISLAPPSAKGAVWIHASADGEVAQESDELQAAVFSHFFTSGLLGAADTDGDRRVTLSEAYTYAYNQTLFRTSQSTGVLQRPEVDASVKEFAPIVLTRIALGMASLRLPQSSDTQYLVYTANAHAAYAEAWSAQERRVAIGLPAGRYIVHRRGARSGAVELNLSRGETRDLETADFRDVPEEALASKGGTLVVKPFELGAAYGVDTSALAPFGQRLRVQGSYVFGALALGAGLEGGIGRGDNDANRIDFRYGGGRAGAELRAALSEDVQIFAGAHARALYAREKLTRLDQDVVARAGYPTERSASAFVAAGELRLGARLNLGGGFVELAPWGTLLFPKRADSVNPQAGAGIEAQAGVRF
jgi:hypothetical protein